MSLRINFYLEKRKGNEQNLPINMFVWYDGRANRVLYYTGYRIDQKKWDNEDQQVKKNNIDNEGNSALIINTRLQNLKTNAANIYNRYVTNNETLTKEIFKNELKAIDGKLSIKKVNKQSLSYCFGLYKANLKVSHGRMKHVDSTMNCFTAFLKDDRNIQDITLDTLELFKKHLQESDRGNNTVVSNLKRLRAFFSYARRMEWINADPFKKFSIGAEVYGDPITLYKHELDALFKFDLSQNNKLDKVRDAFVFQCCIGCRYGDMIRLTPANIQNDFIVYIPQKTKTETADTVRIPLNNKAKAILTKYTTAEGIRFPFISNVNFNIYLKELFILAKLNRKVVRLNPKTGIEESVSLTEIASSHLARRTFIDILYKKDIKDSIIASMTGHSKNSKAFARYYNIDDRQKTDVINLI